MSRPVRVLGVCPHLLLLVTACVLSPRSVGAQGLTGALVVTVKDAQGGVVPSALVRIHSTSLIGGPAENTTTGRGQVRFLALPPGTYGLEITAPGFEPSRQEDFAIGAGATIELVFVLQPAGVAESIVVEGGGSRLDPRQSGFGTRFSAQDLRTIPTRRSSMFDFLRAAPGISPTSPSSATATTVSAFGSGTNANTFLIDGTNFTCPCVGVARSAPGIDSIQEVQIQSAGASAEFGNMQGAVINVIMRQGGDRFLFDASSYLQTAALTSQPVRLQPRGSELPETGYERVRYRDATTNLGGPILRNRLWFFTGYQYLRDYDSQPGTDSGLPRRYEQDKVVGKITWRPAPRWTVFSSIHDEFWTNPQQPTIARPYEATLRVSASVPAITFGHLTHTISPNTVWDVRVGRFVYSEKSRPMTGDLTTPPRSDSVSGVLSGAPPNFGSLTLGRTSGKGALTHYRAGLLGADHELKLGGQLERGGHEGAAIIPTGERFVDTNGVPTEKIARPWPSRIGGQFVTAAAFASDAVRLGDRLTISAGLRFEYNRAFSQDVRGVDLAGHPTDEIHHGLGTLYTWGVISPRLGVTRTLDRGGRTILRASYGRFYQGVLTAELDQVHPGAAPISTTNLATGAVRIQDPKRNLRLDPDTRAPYTDEYTAAVDRVIGRGLSVAVAYVHKNSRDTIGWTDVAGQYRHETRPLANGMSVPVFRLDTAVTPPGARLFLLTNQDDYSIRYNGVVIAAERRRSHGWQAFGSYTFSRAYGLQPSSGTTAAGEQMNTIGPGGAFGRDPNDLTNARGRLANDRPHALRAMASVTVPRTGLNIAANLQHFSGKPWAASTVVVLPQSSTQRILLEPRGSRRLPSQTLLDLRLSRAFDAGRMGRVEVLLDVLNALNETAAESIVTDILTTESVRHVPAFGVPNVFVDPRRAMLGVRFNFGAR